jgi:hypothetical protein
MDEKKKTKLSCGACGAEYWADAIDVVPSSDVSLGGVVPYVCPICNHEESKVEE